MVFQQDSSDGKEAVEGEAPGATLPAGLRLEFRIKMFSLHITELCAQSLEGEVLINLSYIEYKIVFFLPPASKGHLGYLFSDDPP